jgi:hypothetical protein
MECITFHLQQVFRHDAGEALKYYITNTLRKPNRILIHQFLVRVEQLNSYLEMLPCLYYSPSTNQAMKQVLPQNDAYLATHLLRMCPSKWQTQYNLTEIMTPVNTRALLLILEKIKNNADVEAKPPSVIKPKGAEGKCKMESIKSCIPQKSKQVGFSDNQCALCKNMTGHTNHTILMTVASLIPTVLLSTGMGAQEVHKEMDMQTKTSQKKENKKGQILLRKFTRK